MTIDSVFNVLSAGDTAIVIFTRNRQLHILPDGTGFTGSWVLNPARVYSRVVIYNRDDAHDAGGDVSVAEHVDTRAAEEEGRFTVRFRNAERRGRTERDWKDFANTGQNPIRYVEADEHVHAADHPPSRH